MVSEGLVVVWGSGRPALSVGYDEPLGSWDSGYSVLFADSPDPAELEEYTNPAEHPRIHTMHIDCLLEEHPEIADGVVLAGEHGAADLADDGEWVGRTLSRT